mgnify:CR=1 FL=1
MTAITAMIIYHHHQQKKKKIFIFCNSVRPRFDLNILFSWLDITLAVVYESLYRYLDFLMKKKKKKRKYRY